MSFKVINPLFLGNIINLDLSITVAKSNLVILTERNRTDIVIDLVGLVEPADIGRATRPNIERGVEGDCDLVVIGPVEKV